MVCRQETCCFVLSLRFAPALLFPLRLALWAALIYFPLLVVAISAAFFGSQPTTGVEVNNSAVLGLKNHF